MLSTAVGCANPDLPRDSWFQRHENSGTIICNSTGQRHTLQCQDRHWIGQIPECPLLAATTGQCPTGLSAVQALTTPCTHYILPYNHISWMWITITLTIYVPSNYTIQMEAGEFGKLCHVTGHLHMVGYAHFLLS